MNIKFLQLNTKFFGAAVLLYVAFFSVTVHAQFDSATFLGTVRDAAESAVPNASVKLTNVETGVVVNATTDAGGNYQFLNVKIGTYRISAEAQGFSTTVIENISATVNDR